MAYASKKIRRVELFFICFVIAVFFIVVGKYFLFSAKGQQVVRLAEGIIVRRSNIRHSETSLPVLYEKKDFVLRMTDSGGWKLYSGDMEAEGYTVRDRNGYVSIEKTGTAYFVRKNGYGKLTIVMGSSGNVRGTDVVINNVRDYFSRSSYIITDIPYSQNDGNFLVSEQEDLFPIFGYHNVFESEENIVDPYIDMRRADFENQLDFLNSGMNCRWTTLSYLVENYLIPKKKIPRNTCVMTFDDGRKNNFYTVSPILSEYGIRASFFVIVGRFGQRAYMTNSEVSALYRAGHDIGSHSVIGGSLVDTSWYMGTFTQDELWNEINDSKQLLDRYGYGSKIFAYPLGDYNNTIISMVQDAGYIAGRATKKGNRWRTPRTLATSMNKDSIWTLNYYEPELKYNEEIIRDAGYDGWWQFEEGMAPVSGDSNGIQVLSETTPTEHSYGVVALNIPGSGIQNSFILEKDGSYIVDIFGSVSDDGVFSVGIGGAIMEFRKNAGHDCVVYKEDSFCHYTVPVSLTSDEHVLQAINNNGKIMLDSFRIMKQVPVQREYVVKIKEFL